MEWNKKEPLIILIAGKARSGKGTIAKVLKEHWEEEGKKVILSPYTKYLKQYIKDMTGEEITEEQKPRELLQKFSSELIKNILGYNDFFIRRQIEDINIYSYFMDIIIIPDVRFPEEINKIKENFSNVISIGVTRKDFKSDLTKEQQNDITEISLDNYHEYDFEIKNNLGFDFQNNILEIIQQIEERR